MPGELELVPVWIDGGHMAGGIQFFYLFRSKVPPGRADVFAELLLISGSYDESGNGRALEQPVEGDLWQGFAGFRCHFIQCIHDVEEIFLGNLGPVVI